MEIKLTDSFVKDLRRLPKPMQKRVIEAVEQCQSVEDVTDIEHYKPLHTKKNRVFFRIRISNYRVGVQIIEDILIFQTIGSRGDFYKTYPPK